MRRTLVLLTSALVLALALVPSAANAATKVRAGGCDPIDPRACLLPWPNDAFTVADPRTDTERRVDLLGGDMPKTSKGRRIGAAAFNRADGFSPATQILAHVPGLDLRKTGAATLTDLRRSLDRTQQIAVVNATTGQRHMIWAEIDVAGKGRDRLLVIHPAANLQRGQRYVVGLGRMIDSRGRRLKPSKAFRAMRDQLQTSDRRLERRRIGFERMFQTLAKAGLKRKELYLAWDFTVASVRNITERSVWMRDNAFAGLGDGNLVDRAVKGGAPRFALDPARDFGPCGSDGCQDGENDLIVRTVTGTLTVPCYLDAAGCPVGARFRFQKFKRTANFQADRFVDLPRRIKGNTMRVPFRCIIPRAALGAPARLVQYMHAPYGGQDDVMRPALQALAAEGNMTICAARQAGNASEDLQLTRDALADPDRFPAVADRLQQGALNSLLLGRLMIHPKGLIGQPAFRTPSGGAAIDASALYLHTIGSGPFTGMVTALSPDSERSSLGSGGMGFSLMMPRSTSLAPLEQSLASAFPNRLERTLVRAMLQGQWDRAESSGYAASITQDPLESTPMHTVYFQGAVGDHQVPAIATETHARTVEAVKRDPLYDNGRSADKITGYGIVEVAQLELGSVLSMWDGGPVREGGALGTPLAPLDATPPTAGADPHELPSQTPAARQALSQFMRPEARFVDVCPPRRACRAAGWAY